MSMNVETKAAILRQEWPELIERARKENWSQYKIADAIWPLTVDRREIASDVCNQMLWHIRTGYSNGCGNWERIYEPTLLVEDRPHSVVLEYWCDNGHAWTCQWHKDFIGWPNSRMGLPIKKPSNKPISQSRRFSILRRDGFKCQTCGRSAEEDGVKLHVDHQQPLSKGGSNDDENLWTLCQDCNLGKGATL